MKKLLLLIALIIVFSVTCCAQNFTAQGDQFSKRSLYDDDTTKYFNVKTSMSFNGEMFTVKNLETGILESMRVTKVSGEKPVTILHIINKDVRDIILHREFGVIWIFPRDPINKIVAFHYDTIFEK